MSNSVNSETGSYCKCSLCLDGMFWGVVDLILFYELVFSLNVCMCAMCMPDDACRIQKRAFDSLNSKDGHEPPCGCWKLSPGPLQEQQVILSTEPSI